MLFLLLLIFGKNPLINNVIIHTIIRMKFIVLPEFKLNTLHKSAAQKTRTAVIISKNVLTTNPM